MCVQLIVREVDGVLQLAEELAAQERALAEPIELQTKISRALQENENLVEAIDSLRAELITFEDQSGIVRSLSMQAGKYGLRIEKLKPLPSLKQRELEHVPIELTLKGEFSQLIRFIFTLETQARCYSLRTFNIRALPKRGSQLLADLKLDATIE